MTVLHTFIAGANEISGAIQKYLVTLQPGDLATAIGGMQEQIVKLQSELDNPSVQETILTLHTHTSLSLNERILADNALTLLNRDYSATGKIEPGKFIRVMAVDQDEDSVFLCKVTFANNEVIILAPVVEPGP